LSPYNQLPQRLQPKGCNETTTALSPPKSTGFKTSETVTMVVLVLEPSPQIAPE